MTSNTSNMFLWHEVTAKRGSKKIGSCFLKYITSKWKPLSAGEERKLIVCLDRCDGQNNNKVILTLYFFLIKARYFSEIHQKCMTSGHSFLPCDRDFELIERRKKKTKALVPQDWKYIIASSNFSTPFTITEKMQSDFKDLDILPQTYMVKNSKFQTTQYLWFNSTTQLPCS